jgi:hypothetical protein
LRPGRHREYCVAGQQQRIELFGLFGVQGSGEIDKVPVTGANAGYATNRTLYALQDFLEAERRMGGLTLNVQNGAGNLQIIRRF